MRVLRRLAKWLAIVVILAVAVAATAFRLVSHDPARWHVDPAVAERSATPNDYLVAPQGATSAVPDMTTEWRQTTGQAALFQFDAIARPARSVDVVAGSVEEGMITYVQHTRLFGFPDYITVKAVDGEGGAGLIIWSRSRFGQSDLGANKARIDGWLALIGG